MFTPAAVGPRSGSHLEEMLGNTTESSIVHRSGKMRLIRRKPLSFGSAGYSCRRFEQVDTGARAVKEGRIAAIITVAVSPAFRSGEWLLPRIDTFQ